MDSSTNAYDSDAGGPDPSPAAYLGPPKRPDDLGSLGRYRVLKQLGAGGMGAVFLGFDEALDRKVALKVMLPQHAARPTAKERFLREARAAAKVKSDHVITLHEVGEANGVPFIAMEYLQGQPLDEFLKTNGNPTAAQILRIGREVASGLADAHALGLVHRDIKPANLWLEAPKGRVKILDFGLARQQVEDVQLTGSGAVVGTPAFMSPEQALGKALDGRSDLFSLGGVLYRLCTGRLPFPGQTQMEVLTRLATEDPTSVRSLNPNVPESLAKIVHKLLEKKPDARYASAEDVVRAVETVESSASGTALRSSAPIVVNVQEDSVFAHLDESSTQQVETPTQPLAKKSKPTSVKKTPWGIIAGAAAGGVVVLVAAGVLFNKYKPKPEETKPPEVEVVERKDKPKDPKPKETEPAKKTPAVPAAAPPFFNGKDLAGWVDEANGKTWSAEDGEIVGAHFDTFKIPLRLARPAGDFRITFAARVRLRDPSDAGHGAEFRFRADGAASAAVMLNDHPNLLVRLDGAKYEPVAKRPAAVRASMAARADGYNDYEVTRVGRHVAIWVNGLPAFDDDCPTLPDGTGLLWSAQPNCAEVRIRTLTFTDLSRPSAAEILASPDWEWTAPINLGPGVNTPENEFDPLVSADGLRLMYSTTRDGAVVLCEASRPSAAAPFGESKVIPNLSAPGTYNNQPWLSEDGLTIWFASGRPGGPGLSDIWTARRPDRAGPWGQPVVLGEPVNSAAADETPAVTGDGLTLYFASDRDHAGSYDLYVSRRKSVTDPFDKVEKLGPEVNTEVTERCLRPLADGRSLVFTRNTGVSLDVTWLLATPAADGWRVTPLLTKPTYFNPTFTADGRTVIFNSQMPGGRGKSDLWMMTRVPKAKPAGPPAAEVLTSPDWEWTKPENLGPAVNSPAAEESPTVTADGLRLIFTSMRDGKAWRLYEARRADLADGFAAATPVLLEGGPANSIFDPFVSPDGLTLLFTAAPPGTSPGDIWMTRRADLAARWAAPELLGPAVNSKDNEETPALSPDGLTLYFGSHRSGNGDLYMSRRKSAADPFGPAESLGPDINTRDVERMPRPLADGRSFVFKRIDRTNASAWQWLLATPKAAGGWDTKPLPGLSTETNNAAFTADGRAMFLHGSFQGGQGGNDLWVRKHVPKAKTVPDSERKAATLLNPHADLTLKTAAGKAVSVKAGEALPAGAFAVTKIHIPPGAQLPKPFMADTMLPAVAGLKSLEDLNDTSFRVTATPADLLRLADSPAANTLTRFGLRVELTPEVVGLLAKFPKLTGVRCFANRVTDDLLTALAAARPALTELGLSDMRSVPSRAAWEAVGKLPLVTLGIPGAAPLDPAVAEIIARMPALDFLNLSNARLTPDDLRGLAASKSITTLHLNATPAADDDLTSLQGLQSLRTLEVRQTRVTAAGVAKFKAARPGVNVVWDDPERKAATLLNPHATLTLKTAAGATVAVEKGQPLPAGAFTVAKVTFPAGEYGKSFVADVLTPAFAGMAGVDDFDDFHFHIKTADAEFAKLADTPAAKSLTHLNLAFELDDATLMSLRKFPKLTRFGCYGRVATDEVLEKLAADRPALTSLSLGVAKDITAGKGFRAVAALPLTYLGLAHLKSLDPAAAAVIAGMPKLGFLNLVDGRVADPAVRELAASPAIGLLMLNGNPITDDSLTALQNMKSLYTLEVKRTQVTAAGVAKFKAARPKVNIVWDDAERKAAALLSPHAFLTLKTADGKAVLVSKGQPLPAGAFTVAAVSFPAGTKAPAFVGDVLLPAFDGMAGLEEVIDTNMHIRLTDAEFAKLADTPAAKSLTNLTLGFTLTADTLTALRKFPKVTSLGCYGQAATDDLLERLAADHPALTDLGLHVLGKGLTQKGWAAVAKLPLAFLNLSGAEQFDAAAAKAIAGMPTLKILFLYNGRLGDGAARELAASKSLDLLAMSGAGVTDDDLIGLLAMKSLSRLDVKNTKVTAAGVAKFKAARPGVTVEWTDAAAKK